jgi:hypothetical protein
MSMIVLQPSTSVPASRHAPRQGISRTGSIADQNPLRARPEIVRAYRLLLAAFEYARDAKLDPSQFAVELEELQQRGIATADLRWLVAARIAEHRREVTIPGERERSFRPLAATEFPNATAVVLTAQGAQRLATILPPPRRRSRRRVARVKSGPKIEMLDDGRSPAPQARKPVWDQPRRELRYMTQIVKRFRVPAPNQETILEAFQEENWPHCIDDPLPPQQGAPPKGRLLATIKSLNRSQVAPLLLFHGNGNGVQVYWEPRTVRAESHRHSGTMPGSHLHCSGIAPCVHLSMSTS